jgi:vitamin B12 transporter
MFKNLLTIAFICCSTPLLSLSQSTDTLWLPIVEVTADRFEISEQNRPDFIQHLSIQNPQRGNRATVGDLLQSNHRFLLRSYGPGAAQTVGSQGYSSSQVKVVWNGMEINHRMLGLSDLSLIPAVLLSDVFINSTLGSSEYGANALGGTILLENRVEGEDYIRLGYQYASFFNHTTHIKINKRLNNWHINLGFAYLSQENSYSFEDVTQNPPIKKRRTNAEKNLSAGSIVFQYTGPHFHNRTSLLLTDSKAQIPGPIVAPSTVAYQDDVIFRINNSTGYQLMSNLYSSMRVGYSRHQLDFIDSNSNIFSLSKSHNAGSELNIRFANSPKYQTRFRVGLDYTWLETSEYEANSLLHIYQQFNGLYTIYDKLMIFPSIRFDQYDQFDDALSLGLGINYEIMTDKMFFIVNLNRNYSPPTYNDLYWPGLGNPQLKPETAFKFSTGLKYNLDKFIVSAEYFQSSINDGILWSPDNTGRFRPNNINSLLNSGLSIDSRLNFVFNDTYVSGQLGWTYIQARLNDVRYTGDPNKGNQLAYHPRQKITSELGIQFKNFNSFLSYNMLGERFTNDSNSFLLGSTHVLDYSIGYTFSFLKTQSEFIFTVLNFTDFKYEYIRWYPMPGRNYQISITLNI